MNRGWSYLIPVCGAVLLAAIACGPRLQLGPGTECPVGPSMGIVNYQHVFTAKIIHDETWVFGRFAWGDSNGQWITVSDTTQYLKETHVFTRRGRYRVAGQMRNSTGQESAWSDSMFIQIDTMPCGDDR